MLHRSGMMDADVQFVGETRMQGRRVIRPLPQRAVTGLKLYVERNGDQPSRSLTFSKSQTSFVNVGRKSSAAEEECWPADEAMFRCPVVSRKHAKIAFSDAGSAYLIDLGSHHGTYIMKPGETVAKRMKAQTSMTLGDGDIITFGKAVKTDEDLVRPVTARVQLLHGAISDSPIIRRTASKTGVASSSTAMSPSVKRSSSGRFGLFYSSTSSSEDGPSHSDVEHDSDVEEVPNPASVIGSQPLEEIVSENQNSTPNLSMRLPSFRAFNVDLPIFRRFVPVHMPSFPAVLPLIQRNPSNSHAGADGDNVSMMDAVESDDSIGSSSSPRPDDDSCASSMSSRFPSPVELNKAPWRAPTWLPLQGEGDNEDAVSNDDEDRALSIEDMSEDVYSPEDSYVPSFGQSGNRYPQVEDEYIEQPLIDIGEYGYPDLDSPRSQHPEDGAMDVDLLRDGSAKHFTSKSFISEGPVDTHAEQSSSVQIVDKGEAPEVPVEHLTVVPQVAPVAIPAAVSSSNTNELQTSLAAFDRGLKDLKDRLDSHIATTKETLDGYDRRVTGVNDMCSTFSGRLNTELPSGLPERVREVEQRVTEFRNEINKNTDYWNSTARSREELMANLEIVQALARDMRGLHELMSKELAAEMQAFKVTRAEASMTVQRMQEEWQRLEVSRPLKRKRSSFDDMVQVNEPAEAETLRPTKRNRIVSKITRTTAAIAFGAVATWSVLAFT